MTLQDLHPSELVDKIARACELVTEHKYPEGWTIMACRIEVSKDDMGMPVVDFRLCDGSRSPIRRITSMSDWVPADVQDAKDYSNRIIEILFHLAKEARDAKEAKRKVDAERISAFIALQRAKQTANA